MTRIALSDGQPHSAMISVPEAPSMALRSREGRGSFPKSPRAA